MSEKSSKAYWSLSQEDLFRLVNSSPTGLSKAEAQSRLEKSGLNTLSSSQGFSAIRIFLGQFKDPLILILIFAACISIIVGEWVDASVVIVVIIGSALLTFS